jgi:hypothetical protein
MEQKVKIVNTDDNSKVFFFDHNGKTAFKHADEYVTRNSGKFPMKVYYKTSKPKPFPLWEFVKKV